MHDNEYIPIMIFIYALMFILAGILSLAKGGSIWLSVMIMVVGIVFSGITLVYFIVKCCGRVGEAEEEEEDQL